MNTYCNDKEHPTETSSEERSEEEDESAF